MTGANGAKLHGAIEEIRRAADALAAKADAIEDAWASNDVDRLVEMGALSAADAEVERPRVRACACRDCFTQVLGALGTFCLPCEEHDCPGYQHVPGESQECRAQQAAEADRYDRTMPYQRVLGLGRVLLPAMLLLLALPAVGAAQATAVGSAVWQACSAAARVTSVDNPYLPQDKKVDRLEHDVWAVRNYVQAVFDTTDMAKVDTAYMQSLLDAMARALDEVACYAPQRATQIGQRTRWWVEAAQLRLAREDQRRACVELCDAQPDCSVEEVCR